MISDLFTLSEYCKNLKFGSEMLVEGMYSIFSNPMLEFPDAIFFLH
jgi:hypothetical protein